MAARVWCDFPQARGFDPFTHCGANEPDPWAEESAKPGPPKPWGEQTKTGRSKRGEKTEEDERGQEGDERLARWLGPARATACEGSSTASARPRREPE